MKFLLPLGDLKFINDGLSQSIDQLRGKSILISGATGFIGKSLLESLLWLNEVRKLDLEVKCISRDPKAFFNQNPHFLQFPELKIFKIDIRGDLSHAGIGITDLVIHAAADVVRQSVPVELWDSCVNGMLNIANFSQEMGCKDFLLLSSGAVYGRQPENILEISEDYSGSIDWLDSNSGYALGKRASEWLAMQILPEHMRIKIARCFAFVGPYLPLDKHFAIGNFIRASLLGREVQIFGDGTPLRTYLYTSELCLWLLKILIDGSPRSIWNVGGNEVVSIKNLAEIIRDELNPKGRIVVHKSPFGTQERYVPNVNRIATELGLVQQINLKQAVIKTAQWNLKHGNFK